MSENDKLPMTECIETKLEDVMRYCEVPKAAEYVLKAKTEDKSRMCPKCGKTFKVQS